MVRWADQLEKGRAAEILVMEAMSSEESCCEDDENGSSRVVRYAVKRLSWESRQLRKMKKKLDKAYKKRLTKRAIERILPRIEAEENSQRQPPTEFPQWALKE